MPLLTKVGARITTATTTTLVTGTAGRMIEIYHLSIILDTGSVATSFTIQDSTPLNLVGTGVVFALPAGGSLIMQLKGSPNLMSYFNPCALGTSLQIVTSAAGPCNVYAEVSK
jgi:hypothetical protein